MRILSNIKPRIRLLVPQAELSVYIDYSYRRNLSVLRAKLISFAAFGSFQNGCKIFKMDTNLLLSTLDF